MENRRHLRWVDIDLYAGTTTNNEFGDVVLRVSEIGVWPSVNLMLHAALLVRQHDNAFRLVPKETFPQFGAPTVPRGTIRILPSGVLALNGSGGPRLLDVPKDALDQPSAQWLWDAMIL